MDARATDLATPTTRLLRLRQLLASNNARLEHLLALADAMPSGEWRQVRRELCAQSAALVRQVEVELALLEEM